MRIKISGLRDASRLIFDYLETMNIADIELDEDFYWCIPRSYAYDLTAEPDHFELGQLSDDWEEIRRMLAAESEPLGYHLVWLSAILKAIGEKVVR